MSLENLTADELRNFQLGKLLLENPEVAVEAKRLAKKANPKLQIPEIDLQDALAAQAADFQKKLEERDHKDMEHRVAVRKRERDAQIVAAGYTVDEIEKIIVAEKCSYETAMKIADLQRQVAEPSAADYLSGSTPGTPVEMRPGKDWSKLGNGDLRKKSAGIASEMINEMRKTRRQVAR